MVGIGASGLAKSDNGARKESNRRQKGLWRHELLVERWKEGEEDGMVLRFGK